MSLRGKYILVTGGARRIGAAISRRLAALGANVAIHCRSSLHEAEELAASLRETGVDSFAVQADFSSESDFDAASFLDSVLSRTGGRLYGLVNNASLYARTASADAAFCHAVHVAAPVGLIRALASLTGNDVASVVNILDTRISSADPSHTEYLEAKRALAELTPSLALELAPRVRVNGVSPGIVLTEDGAEPSELSRLSRFNPLLTHGSPEGLAECVAFLLSSDFITGHIIRYDGGYSLARARLTD